MSEITVSLAHLREIYRITNSSEIKDIINTHYPKAARVSNANAAIQEVFEMYYTRFMIGRVEAVEFDGCEYVVVSLPNANTQWTLESFEYVKRFVEMHPDSYPVHNIDEHIKKLTTMDKFLVIKYCVF